MKNKLKKISQIPLVRYLGIFVILILFHQFLHFSNDDTVYFSHQLDTVSWPDFLNFRYNNWTSRVIIEGLLVAVSRNVHLWRILNSLVICLLVYSIQCLCFKEHKLRNILLTFLFLFIYPIYDMDEAGFCATTLNYLWPLSFLLFSFLPFIDLIKKRKNPMWLYPFCYLAATFASNQEQAVCIMIVVALVVLIYCIKMKYKIIYPLSILIIGISSLIFTLSCPGNELRFASEMNASYPNYSNIDFFGKLYLGISSSVSIWFRNIFILWSLCGMLFLAIFKTKQNRITKVFAFTLFGGVSFLSGIRVFEFITHKKYLFFHYYLEVGNPFQGSLLNYVFLLLGIGIILGICYLVYRLFREKSFWLIFMILLGCGTRVMMGFSPTIFASGSRTMIFLNFSFLLVTIITYFQFQNLFSKKETFCIVSMAILMNITNLFLLIVSS